MSYETGLQIYFKKSPIQVFSCEFCEIFKKIFFTEHPRWLFLLKMIKAYVMSIAFNYRISVKESNVKLSLNLHNNFYNDNNLVLCNSGLF